MTQLFKNGSNRKSAAARVKLRICFRSAHRGEAGGQGDFTEGERGEEEGQAPINPAM